MTMPLRTALVLLLCLSLLLPAHGLVASSGVEPTVDVSPGSASPDSGCHHAAPAAEPIPDSAQSEGSGKGDGAIYQTALVENGTGNDPTCCNDCDCGCLPTAALMVMADRRHASLPGPLAASRVAIVPTASGESPLRPPIG